MFTTLILLISLHYYLVVPATATTSELILDGDPSWQTNQWYEQVDGVMGGQSSGSLSFINSNSILSFTGTISLDGGGFSSVRKRQFDNKVLDLSTYDGIVVTLISTSAFKDNNNNIIEPPLGLHLQFHDTTSSYGYASAFAVPLTFTSNEEISVFLPLSSFDRATRFGFQCNSNNIDCQIDWRYINGMDVYVLFQEGDFHVKMKRISAVKEKNDDDDATTTTTTTSFVSPTIYIDSMNDMQDLIMSTIKSGGALYDYDYKELCIAIYRSTLNTLLEANNHPSSSSGEEDEVVSNRIRGMICQGLQRADAQGNSKVDVAWTLRYTMDAILEEMGVKEQQQAVQGGSGPWRPDVATAQTYQCNGVTSGSGTYAIVPRSEPSSQTPTTEPTIMATNAKPIIVSSLIPSSPSSADIPSETTITNRPTTITINTLMPTIQINDNTTSPTTTATTTPNPMPMIAMSTQPHTIMIDPGGDMNNTSSESSSILVDDINTNENKDMVSSTTSASPSSSKTRVMLSFYSIFASVGLYDMFG